LIHLNIYISGQTSAQPPTYEEANNSFNSDGKTPNHTKAVEEIVLVNSKKFGFGFDYCYLTNKKTGSKSIFIMNIECSKAHAASGKIFKTFSSQSSIYVLYRVFELWM